MFRTFALAAAATLPLAATLAPTPAPAQSLTLTFGDAVVEGVSWRDRRGGRHDDGRWRHGPRWDHRGQGFRPYPPRHAFAPACTVRAVRYWDGWQWVVERRRICG